MKKAPMKFFYADYEFAIEDADTPGVKPYESVKEAMEEADSLLNDGPKETVCIYECNLLKAVTLRKQVRTFKPAETK